MARTFNTEGYCDPNYNYMVDLTGRLVQIKAMVDNGKYFTINRGRQYGKTTTLIALEGYLEPYYQVISLDFQMLSSACFENEASFVSSFSREILYAAESMPVQVKAELESYSRGNDSELTLPVLFKTLEKFCRESDKKLVLMIDEVDSASNNQVFLDFLAQLRAYYLKRRKVTTFQSVILAGVHDVRSIKRKIRPEEDHKANSPWNIAADYTVDMNFCADEIEVMLMEYENDYSTGMDVKSMAQSIYDYTSGYPYLVSRLCKLIDEKVTGGGMFPDKSSAWTNSGFQAALKMLLEETNPLFESLMNKLYDYPELNSVISHLLFQGEKIPYNPDDIAMKDAMMFGFAKVQDSSVQIANRIFETRLYNKYLLTSREQCSEMFSEGSRWRSQFVIDGYLDVRRVLEKFVETFDFLYGDRDETFVEDEGRRYFMLFLKPIINGSGNCYVEPETRNRERMDLVIDYLGRQYVCELKIWHGNAYNERGEAQLSKYLDYFHLKKGYMLSFNFNQKKEIGVKEIILGDKVLIEAVV
ncbi:MAG: AAA-like domain-containing protein [Lachnospiraceae bacterium]|nr:AAA-like domain-containing protein [Lachnospiraceae bacterium]